MLYSCKGSGRKGEYMDRIIRKNQKLYMKELKDWLEETGDVELEEMSAFFQKRLEGYEEHMSVWSDAYLELERLLPDRVHTLLDLGCGTGLELDRILQKRPGLAVTGVDLSEAMLEQLRSKHPGVHTVCGDYFREELGEDLYDAVVSFESLHHFGPEKKRGLFEKVRRSLKAGGVFLEADYLACCPEEEELLAGTCLARRKAARIPEEVFVHFDTPLTPEHELTLLREAGFSQSQYLGSINGASFLRAFL